jgi:hypothetical protein
MKLLARCIPIWRPPVKHELPGQQIRFELAIGAESPKVLAEEICIGWRQYTPAPVIASTPPSDAQILLDERTVDQHFIAACLPLVD